MTRKAAEPKKNPQAVFAWLSLVVIIVFLFINWPRGETKEAGTVSATGESTQTTSTTDSPEDPGPQVEVVAETLNFRSRPDYDDKTVIKSLKRGERLKVLKKEGDWLFVELESGQSGYVVDKPTFIKPIE
jgi:uncharacterized protein YgiM (DUF1202 family)